MFVITADQVHSRSSPDRVDSVIEYLNRDSAHTVLDADRTAGDEMQVLIADPHETLTVILHLTRSGQWSVGCGAGEVRTPLPRNIREATGGAFFAARRAVEKAKKRPTRFALEAEPASARASDAEALINILLALRARRSPEGWELHDLMKEKGMTQANAAAKLGISPQAVSLRARAAELRTEQAALAPLTHILMEISNVRPN